MHEELWAAVEFKLEGAQLFLEEMGKDLLPPSITHRESTAAILSAGAIVGHPWERKFYHHIDAFLAMARSIPDIIRSCFGIDPVMKAWLVRLDPKEKKRRKDFQEQFEPGYKAFRELPLSGARNITLHRRGIPPVEVKASGRWGAVYKGGPLASVPTAECQEVTAGDDPAKQWAATQPPQPVEPMPNDFMLAVNSSSGVVAKLLLPECQAYLQAAQNLINDARRICQQVHGSQKVTSPPNV